MNNTKARSYVYYKILYATRAYLKKNKISVLYAYYYIGRQKCRIKKNKIKYRTIFP